VKSESTNNQSDIKKRPRLMPASLTSAHRTRESSPCSVRRVAFSALTKGDPPPDPLEVVSGVDEQCGRGSVWQSDFCLVGLGAGKRMLPRPADGAPSLWLGVCPGSSAVCRLYRSPGAPPPDPCPSLPR